MKIKYFVLMITIFNFTVVKCSEIYNLDHAKQLQSYIEHNQKFIEIMMQEVVDLEQEQQELEDELNKNLSLQDRISIKQKYEDVNHSIMQSKKAIEIHKRAIENYKQQLKTIKKKMNESKKNK